MPLTNLNAALDNLDTATSSLDAATTAHAQALADLAVRVRNDDISPAEIAAAVERASASANAISTAAGNISGFSTSVAGIEPTPVEVPPVEEIPPIEEVPPVEPPVEGTPA